jgi:hypothetical protein
MELLRASPFVRSVCFGAIAVGCGARSELGGSDLGGTDSQPACTLPPIPVIAPRPLGDACAFSDKTPAYPALAAIVGQDLVMQSSRGHTTTAFHFGVSGNLGQQILSRGDFLAALVAGGSSSSNVDVEMVVLRTDGTVLVDHHETGTSTIDFGISGNAGGAFVFGAFGQLWLALPTGAIRGPIGGATIPVVGPDLDAQGRLLVLPSPSIASTVYEWLDVCTGATTPATLTNADAWHEGLLGIGPAGQAENETASGVTDIASPFGTAYLYDVTPQGVAMIAVPPFSNGFSGNFVTLDATTGATHSLSLSYSGLAPVGGAFLSNVGDSNNPAGFGVDSSGRITMFLSDSSGTENLYATSNGSDWTAIGRLVANSGNVDSSQLQYAEAGGTFVFRGVGFGAQGPQWQVVRPDANVDSGFSDLPNVFGAGSVTLAADGGCVGALDASGRIQVVQATTGVVWPGDLALAATDWTPTWIPGNDALFVQF